MKTKTKPFLNTVLLLAAGLLLAGVLSCTVLAETAADPDSPEGASAAELASPESAAATESDDDSLYARALAKKNQEYEPGAERITASFSDAHPEKDLTLMIYMIGSNLESSLGAASADILEMERSGIRFRNTNLLLYTGGSTRWQSSVPCSTNAVLDMSRGRADRVVGVTEKNADMGAPETLAAFLNFCTDYYPAKHYALILWDHGGGPLWGYGSDELFGGDGLLLSEMDAAMSDTLFAGAQKLEFVGFDACLMGNLETMSVWQNYARYYIASEEMEPGGGWDYDFLWVLNHTYDPVIIGSYIIDAYARYYEARRSAYFSPDITLSMADLSRVSSLQYAWGNLAKKLETEISRGGFAAVSQARLGAKSFGNTGKAEDEGAFRYDLVDLQALAEQLSVKAPREAASVRTHLSELIVKSYSNLEGVGGVTLYYPSGNRSQFYEMRDYYYDLSQNASYQSFLRRLSRAWLDTQKESWHFGALEKEGSDYVLALSEEQRQSLVAARCDIVCEIESGLFVPLKAGMSVVWDAQGVIRLSDDPQLIVLKTGLDTALWPVRETEANARRRVYETVGSRLCSSGISYYERLTSDAVDITAVLQEDAETGEFSLKTILSVSQAAESVGRETVNVEHYDSIFFYYDEKIPLWDESGALLPVSEWKNGDMTRTSFHILSDSFQFASMPAAEVADTLYYVLTLEDAAGNLYVTEPTEIVQDKPFELLTEPTDAGYLEYAVYEDHAKILSYTGSDRTLTLPSEVQGVPVTVLGTGTFGKLMIGGLTSYYPLEEITLPGQLEVIEAQAFGNCQGLRNIRFPDSLRAIGDGAFMSCEALTELALPAGLEYLGSYAFANCAALESITLPASLRTAGEGLFALCRSLSEIRLPEENTAFCLADGGLYSADGTRLIAVPQARTGSFAVAEGTVVIGADAFSGSALTEVFLPEGLKAIENYVFSEAAGLLMPQLPDSLESIGKYAFGAGWYAIALSQETRSEQTIHIGPALSYIGTEAFTGFPERRFEVSPDNPRYSEKEGSLLNKSGDALVEFAANAQKSYIIPEGVCDFNIRLMDQIGSYNRFDNDNPYNLYLPDSLSRISGNCIFYDDIVIHCAEGSYGERFAEQEGITVSYDREPIRRTLRQETARGEIVWQLTDSHAIWASYTGNDSRLVIPSEVEGLPVTTAGTGLEAVSSANRMSLQKVVLPETLEIIAPHAFENNSDLELTLPDSVRVIGDKAFYNCFVAFEKLPAQLENLGSQALGYGCLFTDGVTIPASVTRIAPGAFCGVAVPEFRLEGPSENFYVKDGMLFSGEYDILLAGPLPGADGRVVIPDGTYAIGTMAFQGSSLTAVDIPSSVKLIAQDAFSYCYQLREVNFSEGLETIGSYAFVGAGIEGELTVPATVTRIGRFAFYGCDDMTALTTSAQCIEDYAFAWCDGLQEVHLLEGVEELGSNVFYRSGFASCLLPESLCSLGDEAFSTYENGLRDGEPYELFIGPNLVEAENGFDGLPILAFRVDPDNPVYRDLDGFLVDHSGRTLVQCPTVLEGAVTIPDGIYEIGPYAFYCCPYVTDVYLPDSVRVIRSSAFNAHLYSWDGDGERAVLHFSADSPLLGFALENDWPYVIEP